MCSLPACPAIVEGSSWNEWSASCFMSATHTVAEDKMVKIKKNTSMSGELVIHGQDARRLFRAYRSTLELEDVTLKGGYLSGDKGAAVSILGSTASPASGIFTRCIFESNTAYYGGAVDIYKGSGKFTTCSFIDNEATDYGGGVSIGLDGSGSFISCSWSGNTAPTNKGDDLFIYSTANSATIINSESTMDIVEQSASATKITTCSGSNPCTASYGGTTCDVATSGKEGVVCSPTPPNCNTPTTTGYYGANKNEDDLTPSAFSVSGWTCSSGFEGTASAAACSTAGDAYTLSGCNDCAEGYYQDQNDQATSSCSSWKTCNSGSYVSQQGTPSADAECTYCENGQYQESDSFPGTSCSYFTTCNSGEYISKPGTPSADAECSNCLLGQHQESDSFPGTSCNLNECTCDQTVAGQAGKSPATGADCPTHNTGKCVGCPVGEVLQPDKSCVKCTAGQASAGVTASCLDCDAGRYQSQTAATVYGCTACGAGTYGFSTGESSESTACTECPKGRWSSTNGLGVSSSSGTAGAACTACDRGKYNDVAGLDAATACTPCDAGKYNDAEGQDDISDCKSCDAGKYNPLATATTIAACLNCIKGRFQNQDGQENCKDCGTGQYSKEEQATACTPCGVGKWSHQIAQKNSSTCLNCEKGKWSNEDARGTDCNLCDRGTYNNETGQLRCKLCAVGTHNMVTGSVSSVDACILCEVGTYNDAEGLGEACYRCPKAKTIGAVDCDACLPGKYMYKNETSEQCIECVVGKFTDDIDVTSCSKCPAGYHAKDFSKIDNEKRKRHDGCTGCPRGKYGTSEESIDEAAGCIECIAGRFSDSEAVATTDTSDGVHCSPCAKGRWNDQAGRTKESECFNCNTGRYSTTSASSLESNCQDCSKGMYLDFVGANDKSDCSKCPEGYAQKEKGAAYCLPCTPGNRQHLEGQETCVDCETGRSTNMTGNTHSKCTLCVIGRYQSLSGQTTCLFCLPGTEQNKVGQSICDDCKPGLYRGSKDAVCQACPRGWLSAEPKTVACTKCNKGMYGDVGGQTECKQCRINYFSNSSGQQSCTHCILGKYTLKEGEASCQECGAGKYGDGAGAGDGDGVGDGCLECPSGWYRTDVNGVDLTKCLQCDKGENSKAGSKSCQSCSIGQYGIGPGECLECPDGQYQSEKKQTICLSCKNGELPNEKRTACKKPPWKVPTDCNQDVQYLDDTSVEYKNWTCQQCMYGADCRKFPTFHTLKPLNGYRAVTWRTDVFGKCLSPDTCDVVKFENNSGCRPGHSHNSSELCSQCKVGWAAATRTEVCAQCPERGWTIVLFCTAILSVVGVFAYLVMDSIDGAKEMIETKESMPFHSITIRIVSSFLQVSGMLLTFDLTLPLAVRGLIVVESSTSSLSEQFLRFDCLTDTRSDGDMFVIKQIISVWVIPFVSALLCALFWIIHVYCSKRKRTRRRRRGVNLRAETNKDITAMDGFVSSLMVLFYTLFPSVLSRLALSLSCRGYGDMQLLTEALSVKCWEGSHLTVVIMVTIPGILFYAVIVPVRLALVLRRSRLQQTLYPHQAHYNPKDTLRYGFLFAGYRQNFEWYETAVLLRKCGFVMLSVFLRKFGAAAQVVAAAMVLVVALSSHLHFRPYSHEGHNLLESIGLHACLLQVRCLYIVCYFVLYWFCIALQFS